jgi:DNA-binding NtrC family response regulator
MTISFARHQFPPETVSPPEFGAIQEAAKQLGLGRSTVYREMRRLGISRPA